MSLVVCDLGSEFVHDIKDIIIVSVSIGLALKLLEIELLNDIVKQV